MFVPILIVALIVIARRKETIIWRKNLLLVFSLMGASYFPWLIEQVLIPSLRMTFNYYFLYTIPTLCLGIPMFWRQIFKSESRQNTAMLVQLGITIVYFFMWYPIILVR
jgi:dolichyl-phosphate-mannose--protein O-mannosyl transferase